MKPLIPLLLLIFSIVRTSAQTRLQVLTDSVLLTNGDLVIQNGTDTINGFLYNIGHGHTVFRHGLIKLNDSTYLIGADTLKLQPGAAAAWGLAGNAGTSPGTNFLGTTDSESLIIKTNGQQIAAFSGDGNFSTAIGSGASAGGNNAFALGRNTITTADETFALGDGAIAGGHFDFAEGQNAVSGGEGYSTAIGLQAKANASLATAIGCYNTANGYGSFATGYSTIANGTYSAASGDSTTAMSANETAMGSYNTTYTPSGPYSWVGTDRLFIVGNGNADSARHSDALTILKNGKTGIGINHFEADTTHSLLEVNGQAQIDTLLPGNSSDSIVTLGSNNVLHKRSISSVVSTYTETDPVYTANGVALAGTQTITGDKTFSSIPSYTSYNTSDHTTNYERMAAQWQSNAYTVGSYAGGTGTPRSLKFGIQTTNGTTTLANGRIFSINTSASTSSGVFDFNQTNTSIAGPMVTMQGNGAASSGTQDWLSIQPTISQSSTAGYSALLISPYESSTGSGSKYLINAGTSSAGSGGGTFTQNFSVTDSGYGYFRGRLSSGTTSTGSQFNLGASITEAAWGTAGVMMNIAAATFTDNSSSGTVASNMVNTFGTPSLAASSATTYSNAATVYINGAPAAGTNVTITDPAALRVATGVSELAGGFNTGSGTISNLYIPALGNAVSFGSTQLQFAGSSNVYAHAVVNSGTATTIATNNPYANLVIGSAPVTTPATGTNALLANEVINPVGTVTSGGATVTSTASLYVNGAGSGGTNNYTQWNSSGTTRLNTGMVMNRTAVADSAYTIRTTDYIVAYSSLTTARTVTLPSSGITAGQEYIVKDESGNAATDNITVAGTIDGATNKVISTAYGVVRLYYNGSAWFTW